MSVSLALVIDGSYIAGADASRAALYGFGPGSLDCPIYADHGRLWAGSRGALESGSNGPTWPVAEPWLSL